MFVMSVFTTLMQIGFFLTQNNYFVSACKKANALLILPCRYFRYLRDNRISRGISKQWGFTLIEILLVIAIIAILSAIAVPRLLSLQPGMKADNTASILVNDILWARSNAVGQNTTVTVTFNNINDGNDTNDSYTISGGTISKTTSIGYGNMFGFIAGVKAVNDSVTAIGGAVDFPVGTSSTLFRLSSQGGVADAGGSALSGGIYLLPANDMADGSSANLRGIRVFSAGNVKIFKYKNGTWN